MKYSSIFKALGLIIGILAFFLLAPALYSFVLDTDDFPAFLYSFVICLLVSVLLSFIPKSKQSLGDRDSYLLVALGWLSAGLFGCLPYIFSNSIPSFTDAFFESISGFTTTGATILVDIEKMPPAILLWRSMTQWLGGMGIIVLFMAVIPYLNIGGMSIFQAEVPGPTAEKLTPRIQDTAKALWMVYLILTGALVVLLWLNGMTFFQAVNHSLTTMSTGGFSTENASVAAFKAPVIEWILIMFMLLAGINFSLHYRFLFKGFKPKFYYKDPEFIFYLLLIVGVILSVAGVVFLRQGGDVSVIFRDACFTVVSILTTTGFGTADYELWPIFSQFILLFLMIAGGCAGSTSGGVKMVRVMLSLKYIYTEMLKLIHPSMVRTVKLRNSMVDKDVQAGILGFLSIYVAVMVSSILLVSLDTDDMLTAIGGVVSAMGNIGPAFGSVGPTENYAHLGQFTKWVLSMDMVMGRLEILTILILFLPHTWKK